jgi:aminoglycoside 6-adenylyltransferase
MRHGWQVSTGKFGKWLQRYLPEDIWQDYAKTYAGGGDEETWQALFELLRLTRRVGQEVAGHLGYAYPLEDDRRMNAYLWTVRALPKDALDFGEVHSEP